MRSTVTLHLKLMDCGRWDSARQGFILDPGRFEILVGSSSEDIRATAHVVMVP